MKVKYDREADVLVMVLSDEKPGFWGTVRGCNHPL